MPESVAFSDPTAHTNPDDIEKYLSFLAGATGEKEIFTYCLMDAASEGVITGCGVMHGKAPHLVELLEKVPGSTLHVCLNRTNTRGRRTEHMVSCRVLCADLDTVKTTGEIKELIELYNPGMIVESSPGRYHLYWKIDSAIPLREWSTLQLGLAELLGGDYALQQMTHTIRVPGVMRVRDSVEVMPRIVWLPPEEEQPAELSHEGALLKFKTILEAAEKAKEKIKAQNKQIRKAVRGAKKGKPISLSVTSEMGRNNYLFAYLKEWIISAEVAPTQEEVTCEAQRVNTCDFGGNLLPGAEVVNVIRKVWAKAIATREWKEEQKEKRLEELTVQVIPELVAQNGQHVNGEMFAYDFSTDLKLKEAPYTDLGLVRRVLQRFGKYILSTGKLTYAFDERIPGWQPQKSQKDVLTHFVGECVNDLIGEFGFTELFCTDEDGRLSDKMRARAIARFCSNYTISSTVTRLLSHPDVRKIAITQFDQNPDKIQWLNGLLDMVTTEFRAPVAEDLLLHRSDVEWRREATCDGWKEFLAQVFAENDDPESMVSFMQEVFGYTLSGRMNVRKIFIHLGHGSNGKSKVLGALYKLLGRDYATLMGSSTVSKSKTGVAKEIERVGAKMEGKRLVIIDDLDSRTEWNEGLVKTMIGPNIVARNLYEEERDITNQAKFHVGCNTAPDPQEENIGILRRLCIIPYPRQFKPNDEKEESIDAMIETEMPGIAQWAVYGYRILRERGYMLFPKEVESKTDEYRREHFTKENAVLEQFALPTNEVPGEWVSLENLVKEVHQEMPLHSNEKVTPDALGRSFKALGFPHDRKREKTGEDKKTFYQVVRLK